MGSKIFGTLLVVLGLGVLVFLARSGAVGSLLNIAGEFTLRPAVSTSTAGRKPERQSVSPGTPPPKSVPKPAPAPEKPKIDPRSLPEGFTLDDVSRYAGMVRLSVSRSRITVGASFSGTSTVNITGWTLKSKRGTTMVIPQAVDVYEPSGLVPEGDIVLSGGEVLKIHFGQSAIGVNFRLNKCVGYLGNTNKFSPPLPKDCPNPADDFDMSAVSGVCQDRIRSLSSCRLPGTDLNVPHWDYVCGNYLDEINFYGCFRRHRLDADFLSREWWVWSGQNFLDLGHDRILLLDREGKFVTAYSY